MESIHFYYSFIIKITYFICRSNCFNFQDCYNYITIEGRKKFVPKSLPKKKKEKKVANRDKRSEHPLYIPARMPLHPARTQSGTAANGLHCSRDC